MQRRIRHRLIQTAILAVVVGAGYGVYTRVAAPRPTMLAEFAARELKAIFGPDVATGEMDVDLLDGVLIPDLEVGSAEWPGSPPLTADWVKIEHDVVALASGAYVPTAIHIQDATLWAVETEDGLRLPFPFELEARGGGRIPSLEISGGTVYLRPRPDSRHFRADPPLAIGGIHATVKPDRDGRVRIEGAFRPLDLGHDDVRVTLTGWADPAADRLELAAEWRPLRLHAQLLDRLEPGLADQLSSLGIQQGALTVSLTREPRAGEGEIEVSARFEGTLVEPPRELPGGILIDARTREQVAEVFRRAAVDVRLSERGIDIGRLAPELPEGSIEASGFIAEDGDTVDLMVVFKDLRIEDETIRKVLGPEGALVYEEFQPRGSVEVTLHVRKEPGSPVDWDVYAELDDGSFRYVGRPREDGSPRGFPYEMSQVSGYLFFEDDLVLFEEDIVGFNGGATVRILSHREQAWTGGETGRIRLTEQGPDIRVTIEALEVPVDDTLEEAIQQSELKPLLDRFEVAGILDRVLVDVISEPGRDKRAEAQVRVEFENERFRYLDFPMLLEEVTGVATMTKPPLPEGGRGHLVNVDVVGTSDGAPVEVRAAVDLAARTGRLKVEARDVPLEGEVTATVLEAPLTREGVAPIWQYLDPRGRADVFADLPLEDDPDPLKIRIRLKETSVRLDAANTATPIIVTGIEGTLAVDGEVVTIEGLEGDLGENRVRIEGTIVGGTDGTWDLRVTTDQLRLDRALLRRLPHYLGEDDLLPAGLELESGSHLALALRLRRKAGPDETLKAWIEARDVDARLRLPEGTDLALRGRRLAVADGAVTMEGVRAEAPGLAVEVTSLEANDDGVSGTFVLRLDAFGDAEEILPLVPESARAFLGTWLEDRVISTGGLRVQTDGAGRVEVEGPLRFLPPPGEKAGDAPRGEIAFAPLVIAAGPDGTPRLRGRIAFREVHLGGTLPVEALTGTAFLDGLALGDDPSGRLTLRAESLRILGVRAENVVVPVRWQDGILRAEGIRGRLAGGALAADLVAHTRAPVAYEGSARVDGFELARVREDLAPDGPDWRGRGSARVRFENRGGAEGGVVAEGTLGIRDGDLGELPGVANLQALMASLLRAPSRPRFERADAVFVLSDDVVRFRRLDLAGPLFSLPGRGTVALDGTADLVFTPHVLKSLLLPGSMQLPGVGPVLGAVLPEHLLYAVRIQGDVARATPSLEPLPRLGLGGEGGFEDVDLPELPPRRVPRWFR